MKNEKEKLLNDYPIPIKYECTKIILEQMEKNICKLKLSNGNKGTGFFCYIPFPDNNNLLPVLITNNHLINESLLYNDNEIIKIEIKKGESSKFLNLNGRKKYTDKNIDITFIEIKQELDNIKDFLYLDENIFNNIGLQNDYVNETIYIPQYPEEILSVSFGILRSINNNYDFTHLCSTKKGSSGSPILNISKNKVIGVHKENTPFNYNIGFFLSEPIKSFYKNYSKNILKEFNNKFDLNIKNNLIEILDLSKKNIGKDGLKYFDNINFKELKELNLWNNKISDLNNFKNISLPNIEILNLGNNEISDINDIEQIKSNNLKELYLYWNNISDINILEKMNFDNLEILNLSKNRISDINVLKNIKFDNLKLLHLEGNKIENINVLSIINLKNLEILNLGNNKISNIKNYI